VLTLTVNHLKFQALIRRFSLEILLVLVGSSLKPKGSSRKHLDLFFHQLTKIV
jgi:hypothetical protein